MNRGDVSVADIDVGHVWQVLFDSRKCMDRNVESLDIQAGEQWATRTKGVQGCIPAATAQGQLAQIGDSCCEECKQTVEHRCEARWAGLVEHL